MRCASCKHWVPSDEWQANVAGLRLCSRVEPIWTVEDRVPDAIKEGRGEADDRAHGFELNRNEAILADEYAKAAEAIFSVAKAVVNDGSTYRAVLLTRPDFGCVLHEPST